MVHNLTFITDSREQNPWFVEDSIRKKLDFGDYSFQVDDVSFESEFAIERKSMADLVGTLTGGHARFRRELERAQSARFFAVIVEGTYEDLIAQKWVGARYTKIKGFWVASIVDTLRVKYGMHFYFAKDRRGAKTLMRNLANAYWKVREAERKAEERERKQAEKDALARDKPKKRAEKDAQELIRARATAQISQIPNP